MPEPSALTTLAPVAGTIIVALIGVLTGWLGLRASRAQKAAQVASDDAKSRNESRAGLDKYYDQLNEDMDKRIRTLNDENDLLRNRMKTLEDVVTDMQAQRVRDRQLIDELVEYARTLVHLLKDKGIGVPPAPTSLLQYGYGPDLRRLP